MSLLRKTFANSAHFNYDTLEPKRLLAADIISPVIQVPADVTPLDFEDSRTVLLPDFDTNFLWLQDSNRTSLVEILPENVEFDHESFQKFGDQYVFEANGNLWTTDGTLDGTQRISPELESQVLGIELDGERLRIDEFGLRLGTRSLDRSFNFGVVVAAERIGDFVAFIHSSNINNVYLTSLSSTGNPSNRTTLIGQALGRDSSQDELLTQLEDQLIFVDQSGVLTSYDLGTQQVVSLDGFHSITQVFGHDGDIYFNGESLSNGQTGVWKTGSIGGEVQLSLAEEGGMERSGSGQHLLFQTRFGKDLWVVENGDWQQLAEGLTDLTLDSNYVYYYANTGTRGFYRIDLDAPVAELLLATEQIATELNGISGNRLSFVSNDEPWITDFSLDGTMAVDALATDYRTQQDYLVDGDLVYGFTGLSSLGEPRDTSVWQFDLATGERTDIGFYTRGAGVPFIFDGQLHFINQINNTLQAINRYDAGLDQTIEVMRISQDLFTILNTGNFHQSEPGVFLTTRSGWIVEFNLNNNSQKNISVEDRIVETWLTPANTLVFTLRNQTTWLYDPADDSTVQLFDVEVDSLGDVAANGFAYFNAGSQLVRTDGTIAGTEVFRESAALLEIRDGLVFFNDDGAIWVSDGSEQGTQVLLESYSARSGFVSTEEAIFFLATDNSNVLSLFRTDGTPVGTELLFEIAELNPLSFEVHDGQFIFFTDNAVFGSDEFGQIKQLGIFESISDVQRTDDGIVFNVTQASDSLQRSWLTDGTRAGTQKLFDYQIDEISSYNGDYLFRRLGNEFFSSNLLRGTFPTPKPPIFVTSPADSGPGTLRSAMEQAEQTPGRDIIRFDLPIGSVIELNSQLPDIRDSVAISFFDESSYGIAGQVPYVVLDGAATDGASGLRIFADDVVIQGLSLINFDNDGILVYEADDVRLANNYVGIDVDGNSAGNGTNGVRGIRSNRLHVAYNSIRDNVGNGVHLAGENLDARVELNSVTGNKNGIVLQSSYSVVSNNFISENERNGIGIFFESGHHNTLDSNNVWSNGHHGIYSVADYIIIEDRLDRSIRSNTLYGIFLKGSDLSRIEDVEIRFNAAGGVRAIGSAELFVANNNIWNSIGNALFVGGQKSTDPIIKENNLSWGDGLGANGLVLNGATNGYVADNQIYANEGGGIYIQGSMTHHLLESNYVGFFPFSSTFVRSNSNYGLLVASDGNAFVENQFLNADRNVIVYGNDNEFNRNWFGTNEFESLNVEAGFQVFLGSDASRNQIVDNVFASGFVGIRNRSASTSNRFSRNEMRGSIRFGIDNGSYRLDPNDPGDADNGPNRMQNHPNLAGASLSDSLLSIRYSVDTVPANATYPLTIEFFLASSERVGEIFLEADLFTESDFLLGTEKLFEIDLGDLEFPVDSRVVATATDADGNTSEFSFEVAIQ